jgi:hypothetical protein
VEEFDPVETMLTGREIPRMGEVMLPWEQLLKSVTIDPRREVACVCSTLALTLFIPVGSSPNMATRQNPAIPTAITTSTREKPSLLPAEVFESGEKQFIPTGGELIDILYSSTLQSKQWGLRVNR